ncbi:MAG TPA: aminoacyl-tRNA hydrolase [Clostridia bacterium]|nr:aminoacyl-tRNA hydrolase [Clostridia bacterium]HPQ46564.1 aminoacyl-tRNA hydrolase [Clostridia bacterium]HRX43511.1 aminoacyl-tRNA hydrolase [Clostridia bacterium]
MTLKPYIVIGLGNPGLKYRKTRHNMGFMAIDYLSQKLSAQVRKSRCFSLVGETTYKGHKVILAKPQTYMNKSGEATSELLGYYGLGIENIIVIYDDMDVDLGKIRIRKKGGAGSHNGMKSMLYHLQDENFIRIRVGISSGHEGDAISYVLGRLRKPEQDAAFEGIEKAALSVMEIIENGIDAAMNKYNG